MGIIEKQDAKLRTILLQRGDDGSISVRADYALITSEGEIGRSRKDEPTNAEWRAIKLLGGGAFARVKKAEGL